ncbi:protocadherin-10-like [Scyliorhinus canicula]|uniref:protocadherin-10-like n=1 Tax=Scyliorhinus canicula TaxID=7830 RepID=UPI0018F30A15|nr:protocadherin-10-like [Scyliorhinus canicula]
MANILRSAPLFILLLCVVDLVSGQIHYSIPEELERGAFVGNIAEDLALKIWELPARKFRLASDDRQQYIEVHQENGILFVNERIDRELICRQSAPCSLSFQVALDNPLEIHHVTVEIIDVNDNSPSFSKDVFSLQIGELTAPGARFPVERAHDPDVGSNTISNYQISPNEHFGIKVQTRTDGSRTAELLLEKPLDREQQSSFHIVLTASDGGVPHRSGTAQIHVIVVDGNDNAPIFDQEIYRATLPENSPQDTLVTIINAVDLDQGVNAELTYSFTSHVPERIGELFKLDPRTGEIRVRAVLDFEESDVYELDVRAVDNAPPVMTGHAKVLINLIDVNDNVPEIEVGSLSSSVPEDAVPGSVIAAIRVTDLDSGENGQVKCEVSGDVPFKLQRFLTNNYKLVTRGPLDRETAELYNISISAWDGGAPPLFTSRTILVSVADINDNAPRFAESSYKVYLLENNTPGGSLFIVTALDSDLDQNGEIIYSILENQIDEGPASAYVTINSKNGNLYAIRSFDYEKLKYFHVKVQAQDVGSPPLSSTTIVNVIILDQNDNAPVIVSPLTLNSSASVEVVPRSVYPGYLITKLIATDADSGQNARLCYQLLGATDPSLFTVGSLTGEVRATGRFREENLIVERLILSVKDSGQPSLSTTVTVSFSIVPNITVTSSERSNAPILSEHFSDLNRYLIIILGSTSFLFLVTIIFLIVLKFTQNRNIAENYTSTACSYRRSNSNTGFNQTPAPKQTLNYSVPAQTEGFGYTVCLSPESSKSDFLFLKPCHPTLPFSEVNVRDTKAMN